MNEAFKDRKVTFIFAGALLLAAGIVTGFLGPLEMHCFYLFSEGGRFHYEGFGFGSFMFGNIAAQIIGYYSIATVCLTLGYGHLTMRRWVKALTLTLLWFWIIFGLPLTAVFLFVLFASKELSMANGLIALILAGLAYFLVPWPLMHFYHIRDVRLTLETRDPTPSWIEDRPQSVLVLGALLLFYSVALHIPIFFNGIFPFFGRLAVGLNGIFLLDIAILCLIGLAWGLLMLKPWAWWGALIYVSLLTVSLIITLPQYTLLDMLALMHFPPTEMEILQGLPLHGVHLALITGVPLVIALGLLVFSKRHFMKKQTEQNQAEF